MPIVWTQDPAANKLLETDPLALLIGMVLDQQVKMEKAFGGPYELQRRLGGLDARQIASMEPDRLDAVFRERPALHRFPGSMARRVQAMCAEIVQDYGGDAGSVWRDARDGDELAARIKSQEVRGQAAWVGKARGDLALGGGCRLGGIDGARA
jgi:uncharacterized HhH-GPD family protein